MLTKHGRCTKVRLADPRRQTHLIINRASYQSVSASYFAFSVTKKTLKCERGTQCKIPPRPQRLRSFWSAPRMLWLAEVAKRLFYAHSEDWTFPEVACWPNGARPLGTKIRDCQILVFWPFSQRTYGLKDDKLGDDENNGWQVDANNC